MRIQANSLHLLFCSALVFGCSNSPTPGPGESRGTGGRSTGVGGEIVTAGATGSASGSAGSNGIGIGGNQGDGGSTVGGVTAGTAGNAGASQGGAAGVQVGAAGTAQAGTAGSSNLPPKINVTWEQAGQQPAAWYASAEAAAVASNVLYYQNADGGWPKNIDIVGKTSAKAASTIDNNATTTELTFLAKMYTATGSALYLNAFNLGVDNLLAAQYSANGGWPQYYPEPTGYHARITYNDNAMIHVMNLMRDLGNRKAPTYAFVDEPRATRALAAVTLGIECILKTQIVVDGVKAGWCAQHDEVTLLPAPARAYELVSNSGSEAAGILSFLMSIDSPNANIVQAVQAGVAWFNKVQIKGIRVTNVVTDAGADVVVVADPTAPPVWARFYDLGTDIPFFCGRDGIKKYSLAEIELERRTGYAWYGNWGNSVLTLYRSWQPKWAPNQNVLTTNP